jgi:hypothetical protein
MPGTGEPPGVRWARACPLPGTPGQAYVEKRGIPVSLAHQAGVRFDADWDGRPAVIVPMKDATGQLRSVHGRYLEHLGQQNKMLTIGPGGGVVRGLEGFSRDSIILVEGLFDALSLAVCGYGSVASIGRWAPELPAAKVVWLAFDGNRPGEATAASYRKELAGADVRHLAPPGATRIGTRPT